MFLEGILVLGDKKARRLLRKLATNSNKLAHMKKRDLRKAKDGIGAVAPKAEALLVHGDLSDLIGYEVESNNLD